MTVFVLKIFLRLLLEKEGVLFYETIVPCKGEKDMKKEKRLLEEGTELRIDLGKIKNIQHEVVPAAVQDWRSKEVLMIGYMNEAALRKNLSEKILTFFSTSRNKPWTKGATSGSMFHVHEIRTNCEQNSLLIIAEATVPEKGICHTKAKGQFRRTCFYRRIDFKTGKLEKI